MYLDINQLLSLLAKLNPGLTKEFLLSGSVPLLLFSRCLVSPFSTFDQGYPSCFAVLPIYNAVSAWRSGTTLSTSILLYNGTISLHGLVLTLYLYGRKTTNSKFVSEFRDHITNKSGLYIMLKDSSILVRIFTWLFMVGNMTVWNVIPYLYTLRGDGTSPAGMLGLSLVALGSVIQAVADHQKAQQKALHQSSEDDEFCHEGLYKLCRHPNYLGEMIFHLGIFISGYSLFPCIPKWIIAGVGSLMYIPMMISVTSERAQRQADKYANKDGSNYPEYQKNVKKLIPFVW